MKLKCVSPKALDIVRENIAPLPCPKKVHDEFQFINPLPGLNIPALEYLKAKIPDMNKPAEHVGVLFFDEAKLDERGQYDQKNDYTLGPHSQANQLMVRSLGGDWKVPIYTLFDSEVSKETLIEIICALETIGIHILLIVCDQGGRNMGLPKKLGITSENVSFTNPFDPNRVIFFSYDFVHTFKNLRSLNAVKILTW